MGLDDLMKDELPPESAMDPEDINLSKEDWKHVLLHHPEIPHVIHYQMEENDEKRLAFAEIMEDILNNGVRGIKMSEKEREEVEESLEELKARVDNYGFR